MSNDAKFSKNDNTDIFENYHCPLQRKRGLIILQKSCLRGIFKHELLIPLIPAMGQVLFFEFLLHLFQIEYQGITVCDSLDFTFARP